MPRAKRASVKSLSDAEINVLYAAVRCLCDDITGSGGDINEEYKIDVDALQQKILVARGKVRAST